MTTGVLEIRLLGAPELTLDGATAPPELLWRKHLALLAYLALSPRRARTRDHLVGLLWGDKAEKSARQSLREAIRVIRHALGPDVIITEGQLIRLSTERIRLDTDAFDRHVAAQGWDEAARLAAGEFMEGFGVPAAFAFEDWLTATRAEWRRRVAATAVQMAHVHLRTGRVEDARRAASRALSAEPLSDLAVQAAMQAEALAGDPAAALQVFGTFERRAREAGTAPGPETTALAGRIRSGRTRGRPARPRVDAWTRRAPLVGRAAALGALMEAWDAVQARSGAAVATVDGDLGQGKTRVLEEVTGRIALAGGTVARALAVRPDRDHAGSGILGLARGGLLDAPGVTAAAPGALGALAARIPEWADRFPSAAADASLALADAFRTVVLAAVDERPLALVVDEAHWLDQESLDALLGVARDARAQPLLLLLSVVPPSADSPALDDLRRSLGGAVQGCAVRLDPLETADLRALAAWALPSYAPDALDRVTRRLARDTAGIPLLAIELLHAITLGLEPEESSEVWPLPARTLSQTLPADLPDSVVAAVRVGFRGLSAGAQRVLAGMAVLPERAEDTEVSRAVGLPLEEVRRALDELEWQRWVTSDARGYAFVARIVRDIIGRDMLTPGQKRRIEEAAGRAVP